MTHIETVRRNVILKLIDHHKKTEYKFYIEIKAELIKDACTLEIY